MQRTPTSGSRFPTGAARLTALWLTLLAAGCGNEARLTLPATPTTAPAERLQQATPAISTPVEPSPKISDIVWTAALDPASGEPEAPVDSYPADAPQIIAAVSGSALPRGAIVAADWSYNDTTLDAFATSIAIDENARERWLAFQLDRAPDTPWPAGTYEIVIALNGETVRQSEVEVVEQP